MSTQFGVTAKVLGRRDQSKKWWQSSNSPYYNEHYYLLRLVEEDKDARLQNDVSYKKFATLHTNPYLNSAAVAAEAAVAANAAAFAPSNPYLQALNTNPWLTATTASTHRPGLDYGLLQNVFNGGLTATTLAATSPVATAAAMANGTTHGVHLHHSLPTVDKTNMPQVVICYHVNC